MSKQSYRELKSLDKTQGIKGYFKMKKAELLKELRIEESSDTSRKTMGQKRELTDQNLLNYYCIRDRYKYRCRACRGSGYRPVARIFFLGGGGGCVPQEPGPNILTFE